MGEIVILHAAEAREFACRVASQLAAEGHSVRRREAGENGGDDGAADAVLVVWSKDHAAADPLMDAARRALSRRALVPVAIDAAEPPPAFAHLWPIDLSGWDGEADDPRWQFVRDEIALARMRHEAASPPAHEQSAPPAALQRRARKPRPARTILLTRMIPPATAGLAVLSATAVLMATPQDPLSGGEEGRAPFMMFAEPAETAPRAGSDEGAETAEITLRLPDASLTPVLPASDDAAKGEVQPTLPVDLVAELLDENAPPPDDPVEEERAAAPEEIEPEPAAGGESAIISASAAAPATAAGVPPERETEAEIEPLPLPPPVADDYAGALFRDCLECPDMAEIPAGMFEMGADGDGAAEAEGPTRLVMIARPFALSRREITFKEWQACVAGGGCRAYSPPDAGWGRDKRPVINVSWDDAQRYVAWLSAKTGRRYRLPSEAEWEYAAGGGGSGSPAEAGVLTASLANYEAGARDQTAPAASFAQSVFGLYDMLGNVWEWVADCWRDSHAGAPTDGSAIAGECQSRTLKGGAYNSSAWRLRPQHRIAKPQSAREPDNGFRVARDLP